MISIQFIVNPVSGPATHNLTGSYLRTFFPRSNYLIEVHYTHYKKHAIELTKKAITKSPDYVIACGGDGTINEVASCIVGTPIIFGIIPLGSGNGLAAHLNISRKIKEAVNTIIAGHVSKIDIGRVNDLFFFSNVGVGIDALIIKNYERSKKRTLISYIWATILSSFEFRAKTVNVRFDDHAIEARPLLLFVSNSNEMGYGMSLTPDAVISDGMLNMIIIPDINIFEKVQLSYLVLKGRIEKFTNARHYLVTTVNLEYPDQKQVGIQVDGEYFFLKSNKLIISIESGALQVLTNKNFQG